MQADFVKNVKVPCAHCGAICGDTEVLNNDEHFCCTGCSVVYDLLKDAELCNYYQLADNPGISPKSNRKNQFAWLDNNEEVNKMLLFDSSNFSRVQFYLPQMHCSACIYLLEHLHKLDPAIKNSTVDFPNRKILIGFNRQQLSIRGLVELLASIGYEPVLNFDSLKTDKKVKKSDIVYKIAVAGFVFGNAMLLALPDYFAIGKIDEVYIQNTIKVLNIILALPIVFYAATDYYKSAYFGIKQGKANIDIPIAIGVWVIFFRSYYEILSGNGQGYVDSLAGLLFFLLIGRYFQQKTYSRLSFERDYTAFFPIATTKITTDGSEVATTLNHLESGDKIFVRNEELIPGDTMLVSEKVLIDYSFVTGESIPIEKFRGDVVYAGGKVIGTGAILEILRKPAQSYLTQLWNNEAFTKPKEDFLLTVTDKISAVFTPALLLIAFGGFAWWHFVEGNTSTAWNVLTAVLIVACPCALALSAPFTYGNISRILGLHKLFLKQPKIADFMANVNTIVFDKTGTLTQKGNSEVDFSQLNLSEEGFAYLKTVCRQSVHPLSKKIFAAIPGKIYGKIDLFDEVKGAGIIGCVNGIEILLGTKAWAGGDFSQHVQENQTLSYLTINGQQKGAIRFSNQYREGVETLSAKLKPAYKLVVLSGDGNGEKKKLQEILGFDTTLLFNHSPFDKLEYIKQLQAANGHVLMIGDGLNDAGALQQAEIGISITEDSSHFTPASDAILAAENFHLLPNLLAFAKSGRKVIAFNFVVSLIYNLGGLGFALTGNLAPVVCAILMPLSSITIVASATLFTNYYASKNKLAWK